MLKQLLYCQSYPLFFFLDWDKGYAGKQGINLWKWIFFKYPKKYIFLKRIIKWNQGGITASNRKKQTFENSKTNITGIALKVGDT